MDPGAVVTTAESQPRHLASRSRRGRRRLHALPPERWQRGRPAELGNAFELPHAGAAGRLPVHTGHVAAESRESRKIFVHPLDRVARVSCPAACAGTSSGWAKNPLPPHPARRRRPPRRTPWRRCGMRACLPGRRCRPGTGPARSRSRRGRTRAARRPRATPGSASVATSACTPQPRAAKRSFDGLQSRDVGAVGKPDADHLVDGGARAREHSEAAADRLDETPRNSPAGDDVEADICRERGLGSFDARGQRRIREHQCSCFAAPRPGALLT